jgi:Siphovirus Gp157
MSSLAQDHSLFEIDRELDMLVDEIDGEIESRGEASSELLERFPQFCEAHGEKADRIGRFLRMMDARVQSCRSEAARLPERARSCERKATQTTSMVMYDLKSGDLRKRDVLEIPAQSNSLSRPRNPLPYRAGSRPEAEGDFVSSRRGLPSRRNEARPERAHR